MNRFLGERFVGTSLETKPTTDILSGSLFNEIDTHNSFIFKQGAWYQMGTGVGFTTYTGNLDSATLGGTGIYDYLHKAMALGDKQYTFGQEYLAYFHKKIISGSAVKILFAGDSTTAGDGISDSNNYLSNLINNSLILNYGVGSVVNSGVAGINASLWRTGFLPTQTGQNPDLYVIRFGINDGANNRVNFLNDLISGIRYIRSGPRNLENISILLMSPNSTNDTPNGRDASWYDFINSGIRAVARNEKCGFIDTYALWKDSVAATGWMDNPYSDGRHIHPNDVENVWITSAISDFIFPKVLSERYGSNNLYNQSFFAGFPNATSSAPSDYRKGIMIHRAVSSSDWPEDGQVTTIRHHDGTWLQLNSPYNTKSELSFRVGNTGGFANWVKLDENSYIENVPFSTLAPLETQVPSAYNTGISIYRALPANGFALDGQVTTIRQRDNTVLQLLNNYAADSRLSFRVGVNNTWQKWQNILLSGDSVANVVYTTGNQTINGQKTFGSGIIQPNMKDWAHTVVISNLANSTYEFASINMVGAASFWVTVSINQNSYATSKSYIIAALYNNTNNVWTKVLPIASTGPFGINDCDLEALVFNGNLRLRLRRVSGTVDNAVAYISIREHGSNSSTLTFTNTTGVSGAVSTLFPATLITQYANKVDIYGNTVISGNGIVSGDITAFGVLSGNGIEIGSTRTTFSPYYAESQEFRNPTYTPLFYGSYNIATVGHTGMKPGIVLSNSNGLSGTTSPGLVFASQENTTGLLSNQVVLAGAYAIKQSSGLSFGWAQGGLQLFTKNFSTKVDSLFLNYDGKVGVLTQNPTRELTVSGSALITANAYITGAVYSAAQGASEFNGINKPGVSSSQDIISIRDQTLSPEDENLISLDWNNRILYDTNEIPVLQWNSKELLDNNELASINWANRLAYNNASAVTIDWNNRGLSGAWRADNLINVVYTSGNQDITGSKSLSAPAGTFYSNASFARTTDPLKFLWGRGGNSTQDNFVSCLETFKTGTSIYARGHTPNVGWLDIILAETDSLLANSRGNVGIGDFIRNADRPSGRLHICNISNNSPHGLYINSGPGTSSLQINPGGISNHSYIQWLQPDNTRIAYLGHGGLTNLNLVLENSAKFIINGGTFVVTGQNVGIGIDTPSSYQHGGTNRVLQIHNPNNSLNAQNHVVLSTSYTGASSAYGSITWACPSLPGANQGLAYLAFVSNSTHTTGSPAGTIVFGLRKEGESNWAQRMSLNSSGRLNIDAGGWYASGGVNLTEIFYPYSLNPSGYVRSTGLSNVYVTTTGGNQFISGSKSFAQPASFASHVFITGAVICSFAGASSFYSINHPNLTGPRDLIDLNNLTISDLLNDSPSVDWGNRTLVNESEITTLNWNTTVLNDSANILALNWNGRIGYDSTATLSMNWSNRTLYDPMELESIAWGTRRLYNAAGVTVANWSGNKHQLLQEWTTTNLVVSGQIGFTGFSLAAQPNNSSVTTTGALGYSDVLLGRPSGWLPIKINGIDRKIPFY